MSDINQKPVNPAAESGQPVVLTPEELVRQLRALREQIPVAPLPVKRSSRTRLGSVHPDFVQAAVNAAGASGVAAGAGSSADLPQPALPRSAPAMTRPAIPSEAFKSCSPR